MPACDRMAEFQMVKASTGGGVERMRWRNLAGIRILLGQRLRNLKKVNPYSMWRNVKSSVAAVKSCEWSAGRRCSCRAKIPRSFVSEPVRWWWITPSDIIRPGLKFFLRRTFRPFVEKKKCWNCAKWHRQLWLMGPLCGRLSDICVRGVIILRFHNVSASWYLWRKEFWGEKLFSLWKIFFGILAEIHCVTLKNHPEFQLCPKRCLSLHHLNRLLEP